MALPTLAFSEGEPLLLTIDRRELIAHDAATMTLKWTLAFETNLAAVAFVSPSTLPGASHASPWRTAAGSSGAIVVDREGVIHVIDTTTGKAIATLGPFGVPIALAAGPKIVALAVAGHVHVWQDGSSKELAVEATALAIGGDLVAIGQADALQIYDATKAEIVATEKTTGRVNAVAAHWLKEAWFVGVDDGLYNGSRRLATGEVRSLAVDHAQKRVAVVRAGTHVAIYRMTFEEPQMRIKYTRRTVTSLAFGRSNVIAVGLDHGDANTIDIPTSKIERTERGPERWWQAEVAGDHEREKEQAADAKAKEDRAVVLRKPPTPKAVVIAVLVFAAYLFLRIGMREHRSASIRRATASTCDNACELSRLDRVVDACSGRACDEPAIELRRAFEEGRCADVEAAAKKLRNSVQPGEPGSLPFLAAELDLRSACVPKR